MAQNLPVIRAVHTAMPFTPSVGTGLNSTHRPSVYAPAITSRKQAQPPLKALKAK